MTKFTTYTKINPKQSDDKKLFVWEYGIGTAPMKHVAGTTSP